MTISKKKLNLPERNIKYVKKYLMKKHKKIIIKNLKLKKPFILFFIFYWWYIYVYSSNEIKKEQKVINKKLFIFWKKNWILKYFFGSTRKNEKLNFLVFVLKCFETKMYNTCISIPHSSLWCFAVKSPISLDAGSRFWQ